MRVPDSTKAEKQLKTACHPLASTCSCPAEHTDTYSPSLPALHTDTQGKKIKLLMRHYKYKIKDVGPIFSFGISIHTYYVASSFQGKKSNMISFVPPNLQCYEGKVAVLMLVLFILLFYVLSVICLVFSTNGIYKSLSKVIYKYVLKDYIT